MNNKPITINGIDVSKCECFNNGSCLCEPMCNSDFEIEGYIDCEDIPDCYYKQLKCKEQECEKYKQALDKIIKVLCKLHNTSI